LLRVGISIAFTSVFINRLRGSTACLFATTD
jgi:hypothetical protein